MLGEGIFSLRSRLSRSVSGCVEQRLGEVAYGVLHLRNVTQLNTAYTQRYEDTEMANTVHSKGARKDNSIIKTVPNRRLVI